MKCDCCNECKQEATVTIWCPTWTTSYRGPIYRSVEHAEVFTDANPSTSGKAFYFGDDAHEMFAKCEAFIQREDSRYQNTLGMLYNGEYVLGRSLKLDAKGIPYAKGMFHQSLHIVDGKLWLLTYYHVTRLGDWPEAKEVWTKLLTQVAEDAKGI